MQQQEQQAAEVAVSRPQAAGGTRRPRVLLVLAPFLLVLLLMGGIRLADHFSAERDGDAADELLRRIAGEPRRPVRPRRPLPPAVPADAATQSAIEGTVRRQLAAFGQGDFRAALDCALPETRTRWDVEDFRRMVEGGYPLMCEAKATAFERARVREGRQAELHVTVTGRSGYQASYLYQLIRTGDEWCVGGVAPVGPETPAVSAPGQPSKPSALPAGPAPEPRQQQRPRPTGPIIDIREV